MRRTQTQYMLNTREYSTSPTATDVLGKIILWKEVDGDQIILMMDCNEDLYITQD